MESFKAHKKLKIINKKLCVGCPRTYPDGCDSAGSIPCPKNNNMFYDFCASSEITCPTCGKKGNILKTNLRINYKLGKESRFIEVGDIYKDIYGTFGTFVITKIYKEHFELIQVKHKSLETGKESTTDQYYMKAYVKDGIYVKIN